VSDGLIETERLLLRPLTMEDLATPVALHADPRVNRFVSAYTEDELFGKPVTVYALNRPG
jgi:RimJ/RimL family protein N-acetyltransferase